MSNVAFINTLYQPDLESLHELELLQAEIKNFHFQLSKMKPYEREVRKQNMRDYLRSTIGIIKMVDDPETACCPID